MRNDSVLHRVLHVAHDAKCFSPCVNSHLYRQLSDNFIPSQKCQFMGRMSEYKEEGSGTKITQKQGLVETDSLVIINFDMFGLSPEFTSQNSVIFIFCTRRTRLCDKILCNTRVIKCPV